MPAMMNRNRNWKHKAPNRYYRDKWTHAANSSIHDYQDQDKPATKPAQQPVTPPRFVRRGVQGTIDGGVIEFE